MFEPGMLWNKRIEIGAHDPCKSLQSDNIKKLDFFYFDACST